MRYGELPRRPVSESGWCRFTCCPFMPQTLLQLTTLSSTTLDAIAEYETAAGIVYATLPSYLEGLRLPGEDDKLDAVARLSAELVDAQAEVKGSGCSESIRRCLGRRTLVTGRCRSTRSDTRRLRPAPSTVRTLAQRTSGSWVQDGRLRSRGGQGHQHLFVRRIHINQVDDHRSSAWTRWNGNRPASEVVNTYRKAQTLQASSSSTSTWTFAHAARQNVLLLTGAGPLRTPGWPCHGDHMLENAHRQPVRGRRVAQCLTRLRPQPPYVIAAALP